MFTHMIAVRKETHSARGTDYELLVYRVKESGEYRIYITNGEVGVGDIFTASEDVVLDGNGDDIVEKLLEIARNDIDRNEFYSY